MSNIIPVSDMTVMADSIVKSGFYGFKTKEQVMAVMLVAQAENKHPASFLKENAIITGKPDPKYQVILSRFQTSAGFAWKVVYFWHAGGGFLFSAWAKSITAMTCSLVLKP